MDIMSAAASGSITPKTSMPFYLFLIDEFSRYSRMYGLVTKSSECVIQAIRQFTTDHGIIDEAGFVDIDKISSDAGSQLTSAEFRKYCRDEAGVNIS